MRAFVVVLLMLATAGHASPGLAQTMGATNGDPLLEICSGFLEQNRLAISGDAGRLCSCLVREVQSKLSRQEMEVYDSYNAAAKPLPAALQKKITGIATQCLGEAK